MSSINFVLFSFWWDGERGKFMPSQFSSVWMKVLLQISVDCDPDKLGPFPGLGLKKSNSIKDMSPRMAPSFSLDLFFRASPGSTPLCPRGLFWFCTSMGVPCFISTTLWTRNANRIHTLGEFPGGPVVRTLHLHWRGHAFNRWSGN